jgi:hypothetical protein
MSNIGVKSLISTKDNDTVIYVAELYYKTTHEPDFTIVLYRDLIWKYKHHGFARIPHPEIDIVLVDCTLLKEIHACLSDYINEKTVITKQFLKSINDIQGF